MNTIHGLALCPPSHSQSTRLNQSLPPLYRRGLTWSVSASALRLWLFLVVLLGWIILSSCQAQPTPSSPLIVYGWEGDIPQEVFDDFTKEFGAPIQFLAYESQEEAIDNLRAGARYDVLTMDSRFIPLLRQEGRLSELDLQSIPNRKNLAPEFQNPSFDAGNQYAIPFNWGTLGLIYRRDLVNAPITSWNDLWDARYAGRVGIWSGVPREVLGLTLKSMGYSANSVKRAELEAALERLATLKPNSVLLEEIDPTSSVPALKGGQVVLAMGWADDVVAASEEGLDVGYTLPKEGALTWIDTLVVPSTSVNKKTAQQFLDFMLRPEIAARIADANNFAVTNQAAGPLVNPARLNDPVIYPTAQALQGAEPILPLSAEGQALYDYIWALFLAQN